MRQAIQVVSTCVTFRCYLYAPVSLCVSEMASALHGLVLTVPIFYRFRLPLLSGEIIPISTRSFFHLQPLSSSFHGLLYATLNRVCFIIKPYQTIVIILVSSQVAYVDLTLHTHIFFPYFT